jgi:hypothetical protein
VADSQVRGGGQTPTSLRGGTNPVEWIPVRGKKIARGLETPLVISPSGGAAPVLSLVSSLSMCSTVRITAATNPLGEHTMAAPRVLIPRTDTDFGERKRSAGVLRGSLLPYL